METATAAPAAKNSSVLVGGSIAGGLLLLFPLVGWWIWHFLKKRRERRGAEGLEEAEAIGPVAEERNEVDDSGVERQRQRQREVFELPAEEFFHAK